MVWRIDRFEGEMAVIETAAGQTFPLLRTALDEGCMEGDVLNVVVDAAATAERRASLRARAFHLFRNRPNTTEQ